MFNMFAAPAAKKKKNKKKKKKEKNLGEWEWGTEIITTHDIKTNNVQKEEV